MIKNNNQIFNKINVRKKCGRFNIYINDDNTLIYKKCYWSLLIKKLKQIEIFEDYKNIILNCNKKLIFGKHIINGFDVENNGSYMSNYILFHDCCSTDGPSVAIQLGCCLTEF